MRISSARRGETITDRSRSNWDRDDERDFPEYGTPEYDELDELDGVSAYLVQDTDYIDDQAWMPSKYNDGDVRETLLREHCYVLGCKYMDTGEDDGEIIMQDAVVLAVIF